MKKFFVVIIILCLLGYLFLKPHIVKSYDKIKILEETAYKLLTEDESFVIIIDNGIRIVTKKDLNSDYFSNILLEYTDIKSFFKNGEVKKEYLEFLLKPYRSNETSLSWYFPIKYEAYYSLYSKELYKRVYPLLKLKKPGDDIITYLKRLYKFFYNNSNITITSDKYTLFNLPNSSYNIDCKTSIYIWFLVNRFHLGKAYLVKAYVKDGEYLQTTLNDVPPFKVNHLLTLIILPSEKTIYVYDVYKGGVLKVGEIEGNKIHLYPEYYYLAPVFTDLQ